MKKISVATLVGYKFGDYSLELINRLINDSLDKFDFGENRFYVVPDMLPEEKIYEFPLKLRNNYAYKRKKFVSDSIGGDLVIINCISKKFNDWVVEREKNEIVIDSDINLKVLRKFIISVRITKKITQIVKEKNEKNGSIIFYNGNFLWILPSIILKFKYGLKICLELEDDYLLRKGFLGSSLSQLLLLKIGDFFILNNPRANFLKNRKPSSIAVLCGNDFNDGINSKITIKKNSIRLVYAGSIDKIRGALWLFHLAYSLDKKFPGMISFEVAGFGIEEEWFIDECANYENVNYHGFLSKEALDILISNCDCGLVLQPPDEKFSIGSFPSKINLYLSNNIPVLTFKNDLTGHSWNF